MAKINRSNHSKCFILSKVSLSRRERKVRLENGEWRTLTACTVKLKTTSLPS